MHQEIFETDRKRDLSSTHERNNIYDRYFIAATKHLPGRLGNITVGHLAREISRVTRFLLLRGGHKC